MDSPSPSRPPFGPRPLPVLAGLLALGTLAGAAFARGEVERALVFGSLAVGLARLGTRCMGGFLPFLLCALVAGRGWVGAPRIERPREGMLAPENGPGIAAETRPAGGARHEAWQEATRRGTWRALGSNRGYLDPEEAAARVSPVLYRCDAPPADGARVVLLAGGYRIPYARGKLPGPARRAGWYATRHLPADEVVVLDTQDAEDPPAITTPHVERWRSAMRRRLESLEGERGRGLLRALLLGERDGLPRGLSDLFTRTGTRHLLALSGLHVALFGALVLFPLTRLLGRLLARVRPALEDPFVALARATALALYAVLAGGSPSVTRAALTAGLALFASCVPRARTRLCRSDRAFGRSSDPLSIWGAALVLETLGDPAGLERLSLQLSYLATLGILVAALPMTAWLSANPTPARAPDELVGPLQRLTRIVRDKLTRGIVLGLAVSLSASLATLPVIWDRFGEFAPIGVFLSLPCGLLVAAATALGWSALLLPIPGFDALLEPCIEFVSAVFLSLLEHADRLPATPLPLPPRPWWALILLPLLILLSLRRPLGRGARAGRLASFLGGILLLPCALAPSGFELLVLDVGHGTAVLLRAPGLPALVFDAGSRDRDGLFREAVSPQLAAWDVTRPALFVSHADRDHVSGLERLIERYPPGPWIGPWIPLLGRPERSRGRLEVASGRTQWTARGASGLRLEAVRGREEAGNEGSSALVIHFRGQRLVLFGDAEEGGLLDTLEHLSRGPARLVLFPHHGSETRHLGRLLGKLPPEEIWISCAQPPPVGAELSRRGIPWAWTGSGALALRLLGEPPMTGDADRPTLPFETVPTPLPTPTGGTAPRF